MVIQYIYKYCTEGDRAMINLNSIAVLFVIIGGLNWLLFGLFQWDLVGGLFGGMDSVFARVVYVLVGIAALYCLTLFKKIK
jgi:uncharacterized membrane protein YuzA (DUF378 family)